MFFSLAFPIQALRPWLPDSRILSKIAQTTLERESENQPQCGILSYIEDKGQG